MSGFSKRRSCGGARAFDWARFRREAAAELVGLGAARAEAEAEARIRQTRTEMRLAWLADLDAALAAAKQAACAAYARQAEAHPEIDWDSGETGGLPEPREQALCEALYAAIADARDQGRWPRHLHFHMV